MFKKPFASRLAMYLVACSALASSATMAATMNNDDVLKLIKAGLAEPIVLSSIDSAEPQFDTSTDAIIKLKQAGATDAVIQRMLAKKSAAASATTAATPKTGASVGDCKLVGDVNLQSVIDGDKQLSLPFRTASFESDVKAGSTIASVFTLGIVAQKGTVSASIPGVRSTVRFSSRQPVFLDMTSLTGQATDDAFGLVKLTANAKENKRSVQVGEASAGLFGSKERSKFQDGVLQALKLDRQQEGCTLQGEKYNVHRGTPAAPLAPGEYALMYGELFYDFGVD